MKLEDFLTIISLINVSCKYNYYNIMLIDCEFFAVTI